MRVRVFDLHSIPPHTSGWSQRERLRTAAPAAERRKHKRGREGGEKKGAFWELGNVSPGVSKPAADVSGLSHRGAGSQPPRSAGTRDFSLTHHDPPSE